MPRERLTSKTAEEMKSKPGTQVEDKGSGIDNDVYEMGDTQHAKNDPKVGEYAKGDPSAWAEDVASQNWPSQTKGGEKRDETGHATLIDKHAAAEAIASAKQMEIKAVKCIIAAQRILPGAPEELIEKQAALLLNMPNEALDGTLANQEELAKLISKQAGKAVEETEEDDEAKKKAAADLKEKQEKLEMLKKQASEVEKEIEAMDQNAKANKNWPTGKKTEKKANDEECEKKEEECKEEEKKDEGDKKEEKAATSEEDKKDDKKEEKTAVAEEKKEEEKKDEGDKKDEKAATEVTLEASTDTLLDQIFSEVTASETKSGATKLSGIVKKASSGSPDDLSKLWASAPDLSDRF
jgi:colicin import membrane protein